MREWRRRQEEIKVSSIVHEEQHLRRLWQSCQEKTWSDYGLCAQGSREMDVGAQVNIILAFRLRQSQDSDRGC